MPLQINSFNLLYQCHNDPGGNKNVESGTMRKVTLNTRMFQDHQEFTVSKLSLFDRLILELESLFYPSYDIWFREDR